MPEAIDDDAEGTTGAKRSRKKKEKKIADP